MRNNDNVLTNPRASSKVVAIAVLLWTLGMSFLYRSDYGVAISRVNQKVDFRVRDLFGQNARLDPQIKILAFDDKTMSWLGSGDLSQEQWAKFFVALGEQAPKAILVDKVFSLAGQAPPQQRAMSLYKLVEQMSTPVLAGAFTYPYAIKGRSVYPVSKARAKISGLADFRGNYARFSDSNGPFLYGPSEGSRRLFKRIGHIHYDGSGKVAPLLHIKNELFIPHLAFTGFADSRFNISRERLFFGNKRLPTDDQGFVHVDWLSRKEFFANVKSAKSVLQKAFNGEPISLVKSGDLVILLPMFYTGNTDFKATPYGMLPGGAHLVSLTNSILKNSWIKPVSHVELLIFIFVLMGGLISGRLSSLAFACYLSGNLFFISVLGLLLFSFHNIATSWLFVAMGFCGVSVSTFIARSRDAENKSFIIRSALDGVVSADKVERIAQRPGRLSFEASERVLTVLFVDVVGFSLISENQIPRLAFESLKATLNTISNTIYEFGGVVNKNLGDGLLCFFGYDIERGEVVADHAEMAMCAAIRIQEQNLVNTLSRAEKGGMVLPLRIGIHSTLAYMGDLGTGRRIDFTIIGNGVNFAKRLEGSCQPNSILISQTTSELIANLMLPREYFFEKQIRIKHHTEPINVFEYDPIHSQPELRERVSKAFKDCISAARAEQRWALAHVDMLRVRTKYGEGEIINYSLSGMSLKMPAGLMQGKQVAVIFHSKDVMLEEALSAENLRKIFCETVWSYSENDYYVYGVKFCGVALEKSTTLIRLIREYASNRNASVIGTGPMSRIDEVI